VTMTTEMCRCKFLPWVALTQKVFQLVNQILQSPLEYSDEFMEFNLANSNQQSQFNKKCKLKQLRMSFNHLLWQARSRITWEEGEES